MALDALTMRETVALGRAVTRVWWADVCSYIPERVVKFLEAGPQTIVVRAARDRLTVTDVEDSGALVRTEIPDWQDEAGELEHQLRQVLGGSSKVQGGVSLVLETDMVLVRRLTWPLLAEASLTKLLRGQMDALTPWSGEDAWTGWKIVERRLRAREIDVELHAAPRKQLAGLIAALRRVTENEITISSEREPGEGEMGPQLQDMDRWLQDQRAQKVLDASAFGPPVLLALLIVYLPLQSNQQYVSELRSQSEVLQVEVDKSIAVAKSVSDLTREFAALGEQRSDNRSVIEMLNLLSSTLEDGIWLDRFVVSGGKVELSGSALDPYVMVSSLQRLDEVKDVQLKSPIIKGKQEGQQRFQIELQMEGAE